jgi:threonine 3-dehydrogenase
MTSSSRDLWTRDVLSDDVMLQSGLDFPPMIPHRPPRHEYEQGFAAMLSGEACKVVLDWQV